MKSRMKIECKIASGSSKVFNEDIKYLNNLKEIYMTCKEVNKIDDKIGDEGCFGIFNNAKYLSSLDKLNLKGNKE